MNEAWQEAWQDMPEFIQVEYAHATLTVRFDTEEQLQKFAELVGQELSTSTKSIWFPKLVKGSHAVHRYVDES